MASQNQIATLLVGPFHLLASQNEAANAPVALDSDRCPPEEDILPLSTQENSLMLAQLETTAELIGLKIDLNAQKHGEQTLRENQYQLQGFFEAAPLGLVVSHNKTILKVNRKFCEITGYTHDDLVHTSFRRFFQSDQEFDRVYLELARSMWDKGQVGHTETLCVCKDGAVRDLALYSAPLDDHNPAAGATIVVQDITEQKINEETLRLSRDKLQSLFAAVPVGLATINRRHFYSVNERLCDITGYQADELILMPLRQLYPTEEEYNSAGHVLYSTLWQTGKTEFETRLVRKDGTIRDVLLSLAPINPENRDAGVAAAVLDITERKQTEEALQQHQATLQGLFNAAPVGLAIIKNRTFMAVNKGLSEILGYPAKDLPNTPVRKFYLNNEEFHRIRDDLYGDLWRSGKHNYVETQFVRPDGTIRDVSLFAAPVDIKDPEAGAAVAVQDITEQKIALQQLKENEERFRTIADFTGQLLYEYDMNTGRLIWSGRAQDMTGYPLSELNRRGLNGWDDWASHVHPDDRGRIQAQLQTAMEQKTIFQADYRLQKADSSSIFVEEEGAFFYDQEQRPLRILGIIRDVSHRRMAEQRLQESEMRYRTMFNAAGNAILILEDDVIIDCNQRALELFQGTREQILGQTPPGLSPELQIDGLSSHEKHVRFKREALAGELRKFEWLAQRFDGELFQAEVYLNPIEFSGRQYIHASLRDITDRKVAERALRESEFRFRSFYNTNPEGIVLLDFQGNVLDVNKAFLRDSGYTLSQCVGHHFKDFVPDEQTRAQIIESIVSLKDGIANHTTLEGSYQTADGNLLPVAVRGWLVVDEESRPLYIGIFMHNLAKEKALTAEKAVLEKQIIQSQKSESIGTLAGGIAHDFNNILGGLMGYTELALLKTPESKDNSTREYLQRALEIGLRAKELVQQILRFSRHTQTTREPLNLIPIIKESVRLLRSTIPTTIDIRQEIKTKDDRTLGDSTQIHQVLMNLATNGYHAMRESGGTLSITLEQVHLENSKQLLTMAIQPGDYLKLSVADTGTGIPAPVLERIFEPYFTTKEVNEGTGLGLAVTMGIIKSHQGLIEVKTEPGRGTCFSIYLPLAGGEIKPEQQVQKRLSVGHGERILVVDDEEYFREVIREGLSLLGYEVDMHSSSLQALETFSKNPHGFDLLITDMNMPGLTGTQLVQGVHAINVFLPVILCTGFSEIITEKNASNFGITKLLMKPIKIEELASAVHKALQTA